MAGKENIKDKGFDKNPQNINRKGRPRKYVSLLKEQGYKLSEINDTIKSLMSMDLNELKKIWEDPKATILEKTIANALQKSMNKGNLDALETLTTRVFGRPTEKTEISGEVGITNRIIKLNFRQPLDGEQKDDSGNNS